MQKAEGNDYDNLLHRYQQSLEELELQKSQKQELQKLLQDYKGKNQMFERELKEVRSSQNKFQQSLQMSIAQEKEQSMNWKDKAKRLQSEKELLEGRLMEYQSIIEGLTCQEKDLSSSLKLRLEQLSRFQVDNNSLKERYRQVQSELSESQNQIQILREKIITLEEERGEALRKASDQAIKYENYVEAIHKEKQQINVFQIKTRKAVAVKNLFRILQQVTKNSKVKVIGKIKIHANKNRFKKRQLKRLITLAKKGIKRNHFNQWRKNLDWPGMKKQFHASISSSAQQSNMRQTFFK